MQTIARLIQTSLPTIGYDTKPPGSVPLSDMPWYFEIKQAEPEHVLETRREIEKLELMLDHYGFSALLLEDNEADKLFQSILLDTILDDVFPTVDELHELEVSRDAVRSDLERRLHA